MATRQQVVQVARTYLDVKWVHMGRTSKGIDCAGLVVKTAAELGLSNYDFTGYTRQAFDHTFLNHFRKNMRSKNLADAKPGDVLAFFDSQFPCHVGIVGEKYGQLSLIHAYAMRRKVVEEILTPEWKAKAAECYEFFGLED